MAKKRIGQLAAILSLNTAQFGRGVQGAVKSTGLLRRSFRRLRSAGLLVTAMFGAATAGLVAFLRPAFSGLDTLAKTAARLGVAAINLRRLQLAGELGGASVKSLNAGLEKMAKNIAEASTGTGEAVRTFQALGVDLERLKMLAPDEQFLKLADAIDAAATQGEKVLHVSTLMGRSNLELVNVMQGGSAAIIENTRLMARMGSVYDEAGLKQIEFANDTMTRVKVAFMALRDVVAIGVAGAFDRWMTNVDGTKKSLSELANMIAQKFGAVLIVMAKVTDAINFARGAGQAALGAVASYASFWVEQKTEGWAQPDSTVGQLPGELFQASKSFTARGVAAMGQAVDGGAEGAVEGWLRTIADNTANFAGADTTE